MAPKTSKASLFKCVGVLGDLQWLALKCDDVLNTLASVMNAGSVLALGLLTAGSLLAACWLSAGTLLAHC